MKCLGAFLLFCLVMWGIQVVRHYGRYGLTGRR